MCIALNARGSAMDADLYDEFGNYIGPEVGAEQEGGYDSEGAASGGDAFSQVRRGPVRSCAPRSDRVPCTRRCAHACFVPLHVCAG